MKFSFWDDFEQFHVLINWVIAPVCFNARVRIGMKVRHLNWVFEISILVVVNLTCILLANTQNIIFIFCSNSPLLNLEKL